VDYFQDDFNQLVKYLLVNISRFLWCNHNLILGYSPYTHAIDEDNHILRNKVSKTETEGDAYYLETDINYKIREGLFFNINGEYLKINTEGEQTQYFYNQNELIKTIKNIDADINSTQVVITAGFQKKF